MKMEVPLKELFDRSAKQMQALVAGLDDSVWDIAAQRRSQYAVHSETRSIVFKWLENSWAPGAPPLVQDYDYAPRALAQQALALASKLSVYFRGRAVKLMLAELAPGASIAPHEDVAPALYMSHRCHLPITSNPDVDFFIDGVAYHLKPGTVYEIDNTRTHSVANRGETTRVHLICDVMSN